MRIHNNLCARVCVVLASMNSPSEREKLQQHPDRGTVDISLAEDDDDCRRSKNGELISGNYY